MRLPKRGFKNQPFKVEYAIVNLSQLSEKFEGVEVTRENLIAAGLLKGKNRTLPLKVLGAGELKKKGLVFKGIEKFSKTAQDAITSANGKIE
jgi:large subunit ribosomal protein L15